MKSSKGDANTGTGESQTREPDTAAPFEQFLLAEYNNIAQAHFNTVESLANFIKHYIAIASIPFAVAVVFFNAQGLDTEGVLRLVNQHPLAVALFLSTVSLVGFLVLGYVINIRLDAILYARTVNGIRKYFFDRSRLELSEQLHVRALPTTTSLPNYIERWYFGFVVMIFAGVGAGYLGAGAYVWWHHAEWPLGWLAELVIAFAVLHWLLYAKLAEHRERTYLRRPIIGVDVDGVLNTHRQQFCEVLKTQVGKDLKPDEINRIPVHEIEGTSVTERDEHAVFNWAPYWVSMPPIHADIGFQIDKLRNLLGYRVWIFTHRPWPEPAMLQEQHRKAYWSEWKKASWWALPTRFAHGMDAWLENHGIPGLVRGRLIRSITSRWLRRQQIHYDKLIIEGGNTSTADARMLTRNRFRFAKENEFRAFVEDDLAKATKLSTICQVVFLIDHPYNQMQAPAVLPPNIVRVKTWRDIYRFMKNTF